MEVARSRFHRAWPILAAFVAAGCGTSEPAHQIQPLTQRPPVSADYQNLRTPEDKIRYIENSKAPESEKQKAIAQIRAGKL